MQLDVIGLTNPVIATHVYQGDEDNDARCWVNDNQGLRGVHAFTENLKLPCFDDKIRWLDAEERKKSRIRTYVSSNENEIYRCLDAKRDEIFKVGLMLLHRNAVIDDGIAFDIWAFFERFCEDGGMRPQLWNLINRVVSLACQSAIAE